MMRASFATEVGDAGINEDWCAVTPAAVVVLDGLSSPPTGDTGCRHSTPWYVHHLGSALIAQLAQEDQKPDNALAEAIERVTHLHQGTCDLTHPGTPSATVALLRRSDLHAQWEYLTLADSVVVLDLPDGVRAISDNRVDQAAATERAAIAEHPIGTPEHRRSMDRLIAAQRQVRNQPGGYWVASVNPVAAEHAIAGVVPLDDLKRAAVLSDGASRLVDQYARATWAQLLDILAQFGPAELIRRVRAVDTADPEGQQWSRYKISDDATAVYLSM